MARFLLERCVDDAQNQISGRPEIARKFSLECLPNAARRQFFVRTDRGADESRDSSLDNFA